VSYWARILSRGEPEQRLRAARALGEAQATAAVPALVGALSDERVEVRLAAIRALGRIGRGASPAIGLLTGALHDSQPDIRSEARKALERIRP
jgi:HEAT repeat protein